LPNVKTNCQATHSKSSGELSKPLQPTGGQKKKKSTRTFQDTKTPYKTPGGVSREILASLPSVTKVPSLSEIKGFLLEKGQSNRAELPPKPQAKCQEKGDKVRMALSAPPNYQKETREIPLYGDKESEEEVPLSLSGTSEGSPPPESSRTGIKSPDGGDATSEGEPGEDYSGLALTQLGSASIPEHGGSSIEFQEKDEGEITQKALNLQEKLRWMEKQRVRDLEQIQEERRKEKEEYKREKRELMNALATAVSALNSEKEKGQMVEGRRRPVRPMDPPTPIKKRKEDGRPTVWQAKGLTDLAIGHYTKETSTKMPFATWYQESLLPALNNVGVAQENLAIMYLK
jgi:hypothetical protein